MLLLPISQLEIFGCLDIALMAIGSSVEGSRVGRPDELDVTVQLRMLDTAFTYEDNGLRLHPRWRSIFNKEEFQG